MKSIGLPSWDLLLRRDRFAAFSWKGDLFGGLTTAVVSLPMALAFGVASGAGPQAGLYGAILVGFFAALFGGSRVLISEPTGPMTVVMTAVITNLIATNPDNGLAMAFAVVLVAGLTQLFLGLCRLGRYITLMPYSVISGFMSGIGILLIILQLYPLFGLPNPAGGALGAISGLPHLFSAIDWWEFALAACALLVLFGFPASWRKKCPPHLIALVVGTLLSVTLLAHGDFRRIGEIPMGLPQFAFPLFTAEQLSLILMEGMILGLLGCIDTLLTAMIADSLTRQHHDSNRELIGQGVANMVSSCFGGLPGAGATMGTVVNIQVGGVSPVSALLRALILLLIILALAPLLASVPLAVLAAIAFKVGYDILDWSFLKRAHRVSWTATGIMYGVMALTVFVDLVAAVGLGVFIANLLTIDRLSRLQSSKIKLLDTSDMELTLPPEERELFRQGEGKIDILHLSGPMIFGVAKAISAQQNALPGSRCLILDLTDVPLLSTTVVLALENLVRDARSQNVTVFVCAGAPEVRQRLTTLETSNEQGILLCPNRLNALQNALARLASAD
jgi:SulP family sulfate permease